MLTEHALGRNLRQGTMTIDDVLAEFVAGNVTVYPAMNLVAGSETWEDIEEAATSSTLFADLADAGASEAQMDEIGAEVERARAEGRVVDFR